MHTPEVTQFPAHSLINLTLRFIFCADALWLAPAVCSFHVYLLFDAILFPIQDHLEEDGPYPGKQK